MANDGGPAFPQHDLSAYGMGPSEKNDGLSLRDYFAAKVLPHLALALIKSEVPADDTRRAMVAVASYEFADAMLRAREGKE